MIGNSILLDTNIIIKVFEGNKSIADKLNKIPKIYLSAVVIGELYIGIKRVSNKEKHLKKLNDFLKFCPILKVDKNTAIYYGEIVAQLYKNGNPIPTNDVWIAATALQHNLTLITTDKHFGFVEAISVKAF